MRLAHIGPFAWLRGGDSTRLQLLRAIVRPDMTNEESENAQAAREVASLDRDDDPQPGAIYGLYDPNPTETETTHAEHRR